MFFIYLLQLTLVIFLHVLTLCFAHPLQVFLISLSLVTAAGYVFRFVYVFCSVCMCVSIFSVNTMLQKFASEF